MFHYCKGSFLSHQLSHLNSPFYHTSTQSWALYPYPPYTTKTVLFGQCLLLIYYPCEGYASKACMFQLHMTSQDNRPGFYREFRHWSTTVLWRLEIGWRSKDVIRILLSQPAWHSLTTEGGVKWDSISPGICSHCIYTLASWSTCLASAAAYLWYGDSPMGSECFRIRGFLWTKAQKKKILARLWVKFVS